MSFTGATAVMPGWRPEATMIQPIAPCVPSSRPMAKRVSAFAQAHPARDGGEEQAAGEDEADQPAELAVAPFPPVDELELA